MKNKVIQACLLLVIGNVLHAQEPTSIITNEGVFSVSSLDLISFEGDFENTATGDVTNDGTIYYFGDFTNAGFYGLPLNTKGSKTIFKTEESGIVKQITGNGFSSFYHMEFTSATPGKAFDLKNNIDAFGRVDFQGGIVVIDSSYNAVTKLSHGMFTFQKGASSVHATDESHIEGMVEKIGNEVFTYPIGAQGRYRYARISAPKDAKDVVVGQYLYDDPEFFESRPHAVGVVKKINTSEYWLIEKSEANKSDVLLTLSWDEDTTSPEMLISPEEDLHIIRWDADQQLWVDEGGVVDMSAKEVTTIATVKGYGFFTFGTVKKDWILDGDIVIYNLVTADGDGKNDYFIIDNIHNYPNNKVEIFNRWGSRVYETRGYDPKGDGSSNVFRGYSEGNATIDKGTKLPSGTYYYVITYEYTDSQGSRMIKKAANLHLETN